MKKYMLFPLLVIFFCIDAFAQTDIAGTWQGKLATGPKETLTIQFIITKKPDGTYGAVVNSPDTGGIRDVAASSVSFKDGKLALEVAGLSGSYSGSLVKGTITGEWRQPGSTLPLVLTRYKKPEAASLKPLLGEWTGKLTATEKISMVIVFRFEIGKDGKFAGFMDVPEAGAKALPASDVVLEGSDLSLKVPGAQLDYVGKLAGNTITGTWKQLGQSFALNLTKGKYQPPASQYEIPAEAVKQLMGKWSGKIGPITVVLRFERGGDGKLAIFLDSPDQKVTGVPVNKASMTGDSLSLTLPIGGAEYTGKLSGNRMDGTWTQLGKPTPLSLTKE